MTAAPDPSPPLLEVKDLTVSFTSGRRPPFRAVDGVSLSVHAGKTTAVVGESGSGKSVTALSVLRLLPTPPARYEHGSILLQTPAGIVDTLALPEAQLRDLRGSAVAMIFQEPMSSLNPVFTIGDQIAEAVRVHRRVGRGEAREAALAAMDEVRIENPRARFNDYPHQFSGGMRQRVMIAMALACGPRVLLADEPTTALDVTIQAQVLDLLAQRRDARGLGVLLISHDLGVVAQHADAVYVMYAGRIVESAPTLTLFERPLHPYTRGLLRAIPRLGQRRPRLVTIREVIDDAGEFDRLAAIHPGLRPWWPEHQPPPGTQPDAHASPCVMARVEEHHTVAVWRTPESRQLLPNPALAPDPRVAG